MSTELRWDYCNNLQPDRAFAFIPSGSDSRFEAAVKKANFDFDFGYENIRLAPYEIHHPLALLDRLLTLTSDASLTERVVIVPHGPKIFAALATMVGLIRAPLITVMRVSIGSDLPRCDTVADGSMVALDFGADDDRALEHTYRLERAWTWMTAISFEGRQQIEMANRPSCGHHTPRAQRDT